MNNDTNDTALLGKKIFFLYPSTVVQNHVITELIQQEYEIYIAKDHVALRKVLRRYPNSVVFANIDDRMPEREWEGWIRGVMSDPVTQNVAIGIVSVNNDDALQRKYVTMVKIRCGYTVLKSDLNIAIKQISEALKGVDAKGRRKHVRASTEHETLATINLPRNGTYINGRIRDISVVGISCTFDRDPELAKNALFKDIQLKLQSMLLKVEGIVFGSRMDGPSKIYVFIFTPRVDAEVKARIRTYIQQNLQNKMNNELK